MDNLNNEKQEYSNKRFRRTKDKLHTDVERAIIESIQQNGFLGITVSDIVKRARIEPGVFYNRYSDINAVRQKAIANIQQRYTDLVELDGSAPPEVNLLNSIDNITDYFSRNTQVPHLLLWELTEKNKLTKISYNYRELVFKELSDSLEDEDLKTSFALIIAGIFCLSLCKKYGSFLGVNLQAEEEWEKIKRVYKILIDSFDKPFTQEQQCAIAETLLKQQYNYSIVKKATGLTLHKIMELDEKCNTEA